MAEAGVADSSQWWERLRYAPLRWITVLAPPLVLGVFEYTRHTLLDHVLSIWAGSVLVVLAALAGSYAFSSFVFGVITRLQHDLVRRNDELGALNRAGTELSALLDLDRVVELIVHKTRDLLRAEVAGLSLVEEDGSLVWRSLLGGSERFRQIRLRPGEGAAGYVVQTGRPLAVRDWLHPPPELSARAPIAGQEGLRGVLAVPLRSGGRAIGVLMVANRTPTAFGESQVVLLSSLANQAAVGIENARLYEKVQQLAVLEERERIAREMHDGLGQVLGYVNTKTLAVARLLEVGKVDEARTQVAELKVAAKEVFADVREAILGLRTTLGPGRGFLAALREYTAGFERQSGISVDLEAPDHEAELKLPASAELQLIRVVQEALTNVRKHAHASRACVRLEAIGGSVRLVVEDDGQGFDPSRPVHEGGPRFGLQTMRERAEAIGGSFAVEAQPGAGTRVLVTAPQERREEAVGARAAG